jgi:RNA polymerase sigma-70 factor (ECF subfamily)
VSAALNVIEGAERVAAFLAGVVRKGWTEMVQTTAFEIEDDVVNAIYVVRNPDKLRHLS